MPPLSQELTLALRKYILLAPISPSTRWKHERSLTLLTVCVSDSELDAMRTLSPLFWGEDCALAFTDEEIETWQDLLPRDTRLVSHEARMWMKSC